MSVSGHSRVGVGQVMHSRLSPKKHAFTYKVFQPLFDLDEMPGLFAKLRLWAYEKFSLASFRRKDHFGDANVPLKQAIATEAERQLGYSITGRVEMLANMRYFGIGLNPICLYFCYDDAEQLIACVAEVTNTPWGEKVCYAMPVGVEDKKDAELGAYEWSHSNAKQMHVSPFMPMDMEYRWKVFKSGERVSVQIENWKDDERKFIAMMNLQLKPATAKNLNRTVLRFPFMTVKVIAAIYWQAVRLKLKGLKVFDHPGDAPVPPAPINVSEKS